MAGSGDCQHCGGSGEVSMGTFHPNAICSKCDGSGLCQRCGGSGDCDRCGGSGEVSMGTFHPNAICPKCEGSGLCQAC